MPKDCNCSQKIDSSAMFIEDLIDKESLQFEDFFNEI